MEQITKTIKAERVTKTIKAEQDPHIFCTGGELF